MPWTKNDYPQSFKNYSEPVRDKAIEIANKLLEEENYAESKAIPIAASKAKQWAQNRGMDVWDKDDDDGDGDRDRHKQDKAPDVHVVPRDEGWAVRRSKAERASEVHDSEDEALRAARRLAREHNTDVVVHGRDGKIRDRIALHQLTGGPRYHVSPREDAWIVKKEGAEQASRVFDDKSRAIDAAEDMARRQHGTLYVHGSDGAVQRTRNFTSEPARQ